LADLGILLWAQRRNASSGGNVNFSGSFAQSGKWRVVPSARRNGFQSFGAAAGLDLSTIELVK
jgi:hypothetical protein